MASQSGGTHLPRFTYGELESKKQFRTLTIVSIDDTKTPPLIKCSLKHQPLPSIAQKAGQRLEYEAISWFWGADESLTNVNIVDENGGDDRLLAVRPNLVEALQGLCHEANPNKMFWIDALCIDQNRPGERDLQVQHMAEIYNYAQNVRIWLGADKDNSELALKFIEERVCDLGAFEKIANDDSAHEQWKALAALMNRPWFSRRWVVQELALARRATVHCGKRSVQWTDFETAVALFERDARRIAKQFRASSSADYDPEFFGDVTNMRATRLVQAKSDLFRVSEQGDILEYRFTLSDLVSNLSFFQAKEPHDLIYAILSLAKDTYSRVHTAPQPQVEPSTPTLHKASIETGTMFTEPQKISPKAVRTTSSETAVSDSVQNFKSRKRGSSTTILDGQRLNKLQKSGLQKSLKKFKQSIQPGNTTAFPPVNYSQPFFDLCKQFLSFAIPKMDYPNLDIICRPWAPEIPEDDPELPSWIPRASNSAFGIRVADHAPGGSQMKRNNADPLVSQQTYRTANYNASRSMKAEKDEWRFGDKTKGESERSLFVTGFVLDKVGEIEDASQNGHIPLEWMKLAGWNPWTKKGERNVASQAPDALWRTLVADRGPEGSNTKVYYRKAFEHAIKHSTFNAGLQTSELKQRGNSILVELLERVEAVVWNRRLFRSEREEFQFLGLAPKQAKTGDCKYHSLQKLVQDQLTGLSSRRLYSTWLQRPCNIEKSKRFRALYLSRRIVRPCNDEWSGCGSSGDPARRMEER